jgi:hypothetical protein
VGKLRPFIGMEITDWGKALDLPLDWLLKKCLSQKINLYALQF